MTKKTNVSHTISLDGVTRITRPGVGHIYRAVVSIADLAGFLRKAVVRYAPKYQRGFKSDLIDVKEERFSHLIPIDHPDLQIDPRRAHEMAVKYLRGTLYTSMITWNARSEPRGKEPQYDEDTMSLRIDGVLTIPDTAHRHFAYYTLAEWKERPENIPEEVVVNGEPVKNDEIKKRLADFDPDNHYLFVDIYNLEPLREGHLYDEFNDDAKKPSTAVALDLNPEKTPARRFMKHLMDASRIFAREEVETRRNTIGTKSRKLVTNATIEAAVRPMEKELLRLEKNKSVYADLVDFVCAFFEEFSSQYPAWQPSASAEDRHSLRSNSFALSNIMMHPLMRLAFELWRECQVSKRDWKKDSRWREAVSRITGPIKTKDNREEYKGAVLDRKNPDWKGRVLVMSYNKKTGKEQLSLSSTRQTRESAYQYLRGIAEVTSNSVSKRA
jgi:hypothetical protein